MSRRKVFGRAVIEIGDLVSCSLRTVRGGLLRVKAKGRKVYTLEGRDVLGEPFEELAYRGQIELAGLDGRWGAR